MGFWIKKKPGKYQALYFFGGRAVGKIVKIICTSALQNNWRPGEAPPGYPSPRGARHATVGFPLLSLAGATVSDRQVSSINMHFATGKFLYCITHQNTKTAKPKYDKKNVLLKRLNTQLKQPADPIAGGADRSRPKESGNSTIEQILQRPKSAHADHQWNDDAEAVKKPIAEEDLKFMPVKKIRHGLYLLAELGPRGQKIFSVEPSDEVVNPVADEGASERSEHRERKIEKPFVDQ